jgi:hypothetical protein
MWKDCGNHEENVWKACFWGVLEAASYLEGVNELEASVPALSRPSNLPGGRGWRVSAG